MPKWGIRESVMLAVAMLLALSVSYCVGKKQGQTDEKLARNQIETHVSDSATKSVQIRTDSSRKHDAVLDSAHDVIRTKVRVVRDSVFVRDTVYVEPAIAQLIQADDSLIAAQKHSLALQDTLVASLHKGISLRDERIDLLEKRKGPRFGLKTGMVMGTVGTVALVVVAVKVLRAIHK